MKMITHVKMLLALCAFGFLLASPLPVHAQFNPLTEPCDNAAATSELCSEAETGDEDRYFGPNGLASQAMNLLAFVGAVFAVIVIIINGIELMTGLGDPQKVIKSRDTIIYAVVGLIVIAAARAIVGVVLARLAEGG